MKIHKRSTPETRQRLILNWKLAVGTLVLLIVLGLSGVIIRNVQVQRVKNALDERAVALSELGNWREASGVLESLLQLDPTNPEYKVRYAEAVDKAAKTFPEYSLAVSLYAAAVGGCEANPDYKDRVPALRTRMLERLFDLGRYEDAMEQIPRLSSPTMDPLLLKWLARCRFKLAVDKRSHSFSSASQSLMYEWLVTASAMHSVDLLLKALIENPGDKEISYAIAIACLEDEAFLRNSQLGNDNPKALKDRALTVVDRMLSTHREDPEAWLIHFRITSQIDRIAAESDIVQALALAPEDPEIVLEAGLHYLNRAKNAYGVSELEKKDEWLDKAETYFRLCLEQNLRRDVQTYLGLGDTLSERARKEEALAVWENGIRIAAAPTSLLYFKIADYWLREGNLEKSQLILQEMDRVLRDQSTMVSNRFQGYLERLGKQAWASYYVTKRDYLSATNLLEQVVASNLEMDSRNRSELFSFLAGCYMRSGQFDRAAAYYETAASLTPNEDERYRGAAEAWAATGRYREAITQLQRVSLKTGKDHIRLCEYILETQARGRQDFRDWFIFDESLEEASKLQSSDPYLVEKPWLVDTVGLDSEVLRADPNDLDLIKSASADKLIELNALYPTDIQLQRFAIERLSDWGFEQQSRDMLTKLEEQAPKDIGVFLAKIDRMLRDGFQEQAAQLVDARMKEDPDNEQLQQALVRVNSKNTEVSKVFNQNSFLTKNLAALKEAGRLVLVRPIQIDEENDEDKRNAAIEAWCKSIQEIEERLREIEGKEGTEWRYLRARRLLAKNLVDGFDDSNELRELANYLDRQRPLWSATHLVTAMVEDNSKNYTKAVKDYARAISLGDDDIRTFERLAELYMTQGMIAEASSLIDRLGERSNRSQRLSSLAIGLAGRDESEMLETARAGTLARPKDPMAWVWYGQILELSSRALPDNLKPEELTKAENAILRGLELAEENSVAVFNAAFGFYYITKNPAKVEEIIDRIKVSKVEATEKWVAVSQVYQVLGRMAEATEALQEAKKTAKDQIDIELKLAGLLITQGKQDEAIDAYERIWKSAPENSDARRAFVALLASRGQDKDWEMIESIYQSNSAADTPDDRRLRAELFAQRGTSRDLAQAQFLLEGLVEDPLNRTQEDRFRLASVYTRNAKLIAAQVPDDPQIEKLSIAAERNLKAACQGADTPPEYLYGYADFLIEREKIGEANAQADRMELVAPDGFSTVLLRSRLLKLSGKSELAIQKVVTWKDNQLSKSTVKGDSAETAKILVQAGQALNELGASQESETILRQAFELDLRAGIDYVRALARSDDPVARQNAIRFLMDRVKRDQSPQVARLLAGILSVGKHSLELVQEAGDILENVESTNSTDSELLLAMADMWLAQNKSDKAVQVYRRIVELRPNDVVALNNLANLLAEQTGQTEEALSYIEQAIRIAGRQPLLLDTKGVILLLANRPAEAIPILEIAASGSQDPRLTFHLYIALRRAGREQEASRLREKIDANQLRKTLLTPEDQRELEIFESEAQNL
jgi:tetratricopeptide (TPR) repeat protein